MSNEQPAASTSTSLRSSLSRSLMSARSLSTSENVESKPKETVALDVPPVEKVQTTSTSDDILSQSLAMTDLIFGIYAIELWHYDESSGKLSNVNLEPQEDEETGGGGDSGGLLLKRKPQETDPDNDYSTSEALDAFNKLTDASHNGYIPVSSTDPGVGLPGALWAESSKVGSEGGMNFNRAWGGIGQHGHDTVLWRDVCELANDPDQVR